MEAALEATTASPRADGRVTDTRANIQSVALELFSQKGFTATSLRDIAEALGLTKAALYYHFPAKSELARSIFQPFVDDIDAFLSGVEGGELSARELLERYLDVLAPHRVVFMAVLHDASALAHVDLEAATVRWIERFQRLLVGPDATPAQQVRAVVAVGGLSRCLVLSDIPAEQIRAAGVDAALAALYAGTEGT